ncbi:MAG TPA: hypothetical protein ENK46_15170 [Flavobacteriia bacterium]|nr:hypothetical protein [Flavobacteriia bacterium]
MKSIGFCNNEKEVLKKHLTYLLLVVLKKNAVIHEMASDDKSIVLKFLGLTMRSFKAKKRVLLKFNSFFLTGTPLVTD